MSSGAEVTLSAWRVGGVSREEQILPPVFLTLIHAWGLVTTPELLRRSTRAAEQRAGRVLCVPCGRTQVYSESHNGEGHSQYTRAPFTVSCWPFSFMVSLFQNVPKCVLTDHQHVIWRLGFPLSLSSTAHSIYGLRSV